MSLPQVTPFSVKRSGFAPKGASGKIAERNHPIGRLDGPQSCSISPPHNVPGLYLSVVPVSSILIRDPLVSLSRRRTKLASSPRRPGRSASARSRRISTGRLAKVANTSRLRRSRAPANRRGGLVLLLIFALLLQGGATRDGVMRDACTAAALQDLSCGTPSRALSLI